MTKNTIFILSLAILIGTGYGIFKFYGFSGALKEKIEIMAYLDDTADTETVKNSITRIKEVSGARFVSKYDAAQMFIKEMGEDSDIFKAIQTDPIPNSFIVTVKGAGASAQTFEKTASLIGGIAGVEEVKYEKRFAERILNLVRLAEKIIIAVSSVIVFYCIIVLFAVCGKDTVRKWKLS